MQSIFFRNLIFAALFLASFALSAQRMELCADMYGNVYSCSHGSGNSNQYYRSSNGYSGNDQWNAKDVTAAIGAGFGQSIAQEANRISKIWNMLSAEQEEREARYANYRYNPRTLTEEELEAQTKLVFQKTIQEINANFINQDYLDKSAQLVKESEAYFAAKKKHTALENDLSQAHQKLPYTILTPTEPRQGQQIRHYLYKTLELLALAESKADFVTIETTEIIKELVLQSDSMWAKYFSIQESKDLAHEALKRRSFELGTRLLNRSIRLYRYTNGDIAPNEKQHSPIAESVINEFNLGEIDSSTFTGSEIWLVAREIARLPIIFTNDILRFQTATMLHQAKAYDEKEDLRSFLDAIDRIWNVVDYAKGVTKGVDDFLRESFLGAAQLVLHPLDSAEAIYQAVVNYEQTFEVIYESMEKIWEDYDDYSFEEKGQLHSRIATEILATVVPFGGLNRLSKTTRIIEATEKVVEKTIPLVRKGSAGLGNAGNIADHLATSLEKWGKNKKLPRDHNYFKAPEFLKAFPDVREAPKKTRIQGGGRLRERWKDSKNNIFEWDYQHGTVEKYNKRGVHLGEFDPLSGEQLKPANQKRRIEP